ncbi:MAG TPA: carboxypeptidase regulatory-like domain-containing protein [Candidatus Acidoferrum sp.]|nr:carboxypeptidase regulatory-like domain-containing protein [Candidatus Acidoferrum sp.]
MRRIGRWASWAGVALVVALSLLAVGQASSTVPSLLVFKANVHGLAIGNYGSGGGQALAPLTQQIIDDANRDDLNTPAASALPSATATPAAEALVPSPAPVRVVPVATPTVPAATPTPTPIRTTLPTGSISGTVQDSQTAVGIANALVWLSPTNASTVSGSNGAFTFASVPAQTYTVTASATGYQTGSSTITVTAGRNAKINLHLVSTAPSGSVQGVVRNNATGQAVVGLQLTLTPGGENAITDGSGYYGFPNVAPGTYTLTIVFPGYQPFSLTITVTSGHTARANVSVTPS